MIIEDLRYREFGARCVFFDRHNGVSPKPFDSLNVSASVGDNWDNIQANINIIKETLKVEQVALLNQVHSDRIVEFKSEEILDADGFYTKQKVVFLGIKFADCCPIVLCDKKNKIIASVHSGWKGAKLNIAKKMVDIMFNLGSDVDDILVTIGPHICNNCYEIKEDVASQFEQKYITEKDNKLFLSLKDVIVDSLTQNGLNKKSVIDLGLCTYENQRFFSYRRDKITGRNIGGIFLLN